MLYKFYDTMSHMTQCIDDPLKANAFYFGS